MIHQILLGRALSLILTLEHPIEPVEAQEWELVGYQELLFPTASLKAML